MVQGLRNTNYKPAQELASQLATTWLRSNYHAFSTTKKMFEKVRKKIIIDNVKR